ncbi:P63C domain-containing protein [Mesorhizobium sp. WSM4898]|uniref:P63C domain-containing protein n=1 Tax=Mesorhizobium sp. WSM4898 TaxID=3038544 RepID=UPI002415021C|nr:P63C domain-containing protein [Mesorhizobium sp. WSM4898]MDG4909998.1 P63C domain-containing protein [Mesorhizobium sp. WSM4898]
MPASDKKVARAKQGAAARWSDETVRFAIDEGEVQFGDLTFRCAVLDDESRVINGTEFMRVMGIYRSGALSTRRSEDDEIYFPLHLAFKNLRPFILEDVDLVEALREPIRYRSVKGSIAEGIPAQVLRRICSVWVRARAAGVLGTSQRNVADKAETLLNALADVAIIALIDEATGYQKRRAHNELQKILSAYIAAELLPWQTRFPISYYEQIYRVMGWPYDASTTKRTAYIGKLTNKLIYEKLPPGVLPQLRRKNPTDATTKRRKHKHFQFLTEDVGNVHLDKQISAITTLLRATPSGNWRFFETLFNNAYPPPQGDLFAGLDVERLLDEK